MLKIQHSVDTVNPTSRLICCFDVSKRSLTLFAEYRTTTPSGASTCRVEDEIPNRTGAIDSLLSRLANLVCEAGLDGLTVCAEATGGYERKLLETARRRGHQTALISPEHVAKLKSVETSDTGKTDHKDPRVMHLVARLGKAQTHRHLPAIYRRLRRLTAYYDEDEQGLAATRQRIQAAVEDLAFKRPSKTSSPTTTSRRPSPSARPAKPSWRPTRSIHITSSGPATRASRRR